MKPLLTLLLTAAMTISPTPTRAEFCGAAWAAAKLSGIDALPKIQAACRVGDTITLPASESGLIGRLCDFNKPLTNSGRDVVCVMATPQAARR